MKKPLLFNEMKKDFIEFFKGKVKKITSLALMKEIKTSLLFIAQFLESP